jgi:DNA-binding transcriptional MerR regulator
MKSGELARAAGISPDTLRHYEKLGLLPIANRTSGGYRLYPPDTLALVQMIRSAVRVGFTLAELADVLKQRRAGRPPCRKVAELGARHLDALNKRILDLTRLRDWLSATVETWQSRLQTLDGGERGRFLESLPKPDKLDSKLSGGNRRENSSAGVRRARLLDHPRAR